MNTRRRPLLIPALAIVAFSFALTHGARATARAQGGQRTSKARASNDETTVFSLGDFGAAGDGQTDDAPALQRALDALADAGGGTLLVPAGRYVIATPVAKDFGGLASVTIQGVESGTPVTFA